MSNNYTNRAKKIDQVINGNVYLRFFGQEKNKKEELDRREKRYRKALLEEIRKKWIEGEDGYIEKNLKGRQEILPDLETRPEIVSERLRRGCNFLEEERRLFISTSVAEFYKTNVFQRRTLLILGKRGGGKTIELLKLTRKLIENAEQEINAQITDISYRIPIYLKLSSWTDSKKSIAEWLLQELNNKKTYKIQKEIGKYWINEDNQEKLILLLDGLDEVQEKYRENCIAAINRFHQDYSFIHIIICSRIEESDNTIIRLYQLLNFDEAVEIKPYSLKKINEYINKLGFNKDYDNLRDLIYKNSEFKKLAELPLMLALMSEAYRKTPSRDLPRAESFEEYQKQLFNDYIKRIFEEPKTEIIFSIKKTKHWLKCLAKIMEQESQQVFYIDGIQPTWLENKKQKRFYAIIFVLIFTLIVGTCWGLIAVLSLREPSVFLLFSVLGLFFGFLISFFSILFQKIETIGFININFKTKIFLFLSYSIIGIASYWVVSQDIFPILVIGVFLCLTGTPHLELKKRKHPNQGTYRSCINIFVFFIVGLLVTFIAYFLANLVTPKIPLPLDQRICLYVLFAILFAMGLPGVAVIKHLLLRLIICFWTGATPWKYKKFLDYASRLDLLQKVGGGYKFIHPWLQKHFAEEKIIFRKTELN